MQDQIQECHGVYWELYDDEDEILSESDHEEKQCLEGSAGYVSDDDANIDDADADDDGDDDAMVDINDEECLQIMEDRSNDIEVNSMIQEAEDSDDVSKQTWKGFKIIGDNIDKNFRRRFQRIDYQTRSFHYFHSFAALDRVDLSGLSDLPKTGEIDITKIIPSTNDIQELKEIFTILISR